MILTIPFTFSRDLRKTLERYLPFKLVINEAMRDFVKKPIGKSITLEELVSFILKTHRIKRQLIPTNQLYLKHVVAYWKNNPSGSHQDCVKLWNEKPSSEKKIRS